MPFNAVAFPAVMHTSERQLNLADDLRSAAGARPEKIALYHRDRAVSYEELDRMSYRLAFGLHKMGIRKSDRVSIALTNLPEFAGLFYGALRLGAVAAPLNPAGPAHDLRPYIVAVHPRAIVTEEFAAGEVMSAGPHPSPVFVIGKHPTARPFTDILMDGTPPTVETAATDLAVVAFTAGTSGPPKAVMLTHGNLDASLSQLMEVPGARLSDDDVVLGALPLFQVYALSVVLGLSIRQGGTVALANPMDLAEVTKTIVERGVTVLVGTPRLYDGIYRSATPEDLLHVRLAVSGGSRLTEERSTRFREKFGVEIWEGYGLTEASSVVATTRIAQQRPGSIGRVLAGQEVRVVDEKGDEALPGDPGEIWVRGPNVFTGYWEDAAATTNAFAGEWLRSGDVAYRDEDGYLWLVDREEDVIVVSGFPVYPREVEAVLRSHPRVADAAVVGEPDPKMGHRVKAFVVPAVSTPGEPELIVFCTKNLARFKVPASIEFVEDLPRQPTGEVIRTFLREPLGEPSSEPPGEEQE